MSIKKIAYNVKSTILINRTYNDLNQLNVFSPYFWNRVIEIVLKN